MTMLSEHVLLIAGPSYESCCQQAKMFFSRTNLVKYDQIDILHQKSVSAEHPDFSSRIDELIAKNKECVAELVNELAGLGITSVAQLKDLRQGYESKVLHLLSHFMDGFIGIDSCFYNLIDDSHWVSASTRALFRPQHNQYWLIHVQGTTTSIQKASLLQTTIFHNKNASS